MCARCQLKEQLASKATELDGAAAAAAALESRLAEEEEERRNAHTSVMRLEAQVMNRLTSFMRSVSTVNARMKPPAQYLV